MNSSGPGGNTSTLPQVAFDESGNTGANLLDPEQPVFVLASVLAGADVTAIVNGERELKFSTHRTSAAGRERILKVLNHEALRPERYIVSGFHKKFLAVIKMVDMLYEPLAHAVGVDLYERGANLAMANMLFVSLPHFLGLQGFENMLGAFVAMGKEPSDQNIERFYEIVEVAYNVASPTGLKEELGALMISREVVEADIDIFHSSSLDPAVPSFFVHASGWTGRLSSAFDIVHDSSKPIRNEQLILEAMMSTSETPETMGYDRRTMNFPIRATGITFQDSKLEPSLQLADVIAGAVAYAQKCAMVGDNDAFAAEIRKTLMFCGEWQPVWPTLKVAPSELNTDAPAPERDPMDYLGNYISSRLGGIPPIGQRRKPSSESK